MMKSRNKIFVPILVLSLFLLTACGGGDQPVQKKGAYLGGEQGVIAQFEAFGIEEDGVYTIFDEETFPMEVTIRNNGEHELQPGDVMIRLLGPSPSEFSGIASWDLKNLGIVEKISELIPNGGEETLSFATDAKFLGTVTGVMDREWFANIEFNYKTFLIIPEVCLKEDLKDDRVCVVQEAKTFFVSGAPVTVKSVEESTAGKGIMALKILVRNAGSGKVTKLGEEFGVRNILSYTVDDPAWECKSGGKIGEARLVDGQAEIVCKLKVALAKDTLSTKQVKLEFNYKYRDIIQEKLRIKQSS